MHDMRKHDDWAIDYKCEDDECRCRISSMRHRFPIAYLMASLDATHQELINNGDPRAEAMGIAAQLLYQTFFESGADSSPYPQGEDAPWSEQYKEVVDYLNDGYLPEESSGPMAEVIPLHE
jgi:hypothetical protein